MILSGIIETLYIVCDLCGAKSFSEAIIEPSEREAFIDQVRLGGSLHKQGWRHLVKDNASYCPKCMEKYNKRRNT